MLLNRKMIGRLAKYAIICAVAVVSLAVVVIVPTLANDGEAEQVKAQKLWEGSIAAKGGREQLRSIRSLYIQGEFKGADDRSYDLYVFPDRSFGYFYWAAAYERTDVTIYNGKRNISWWQEGNNTAHVQRDTETAVDLMKKAELTLLLVTQWLEPKALRARRDWVGLKRVDVVETDVNGWHVDYYLDSKTKLPVKLQYGYSKIERAKGEMNRVVELYDYRLVSGVMMPHRLVYSFTDGPERSDQRVTYELNVDYDEQIFENPPTPRMKPDSWRRTA